MTIKVNFEPSISDSDSIINLNELINSETKIQGKLVTNKIQGSKGDVAVAIDIITLMLTSVSTLITVLEFWNNKYPQYSITLKVGESTFTKDNLTKKEFEEELEKAKNEANTELLVDKK